MLTIYISISDQHLAHDFFTLKIQDLIGYFIFLWKQLLSFMLYPQYNRLKETTRNFKILLRSY